jgi:hypothetical protein
MTQKYQQLEARLARLERELAQLRAEMKSQPARPWYEQIVGDFAGDEDFKEIIRLGRQIRRGKLKR